MQDLNPRFVCFSLQLTPEYGGPEGSNTNKKETANKKKKTQIKKGKRKWKKENANKKGKTQIKKQNANKKAQHKQKSKRK